MTDGDVYVFLFDRGQGRRGICGEKATDDELSNNYTDYSLDSRLREDDEPPHRETNSCGGCMIRGGGGGDNRRSASVSENAELPLAVTRGPILS